MEHAVEIKVRGYHLDLFGHVNNARYLEFLEEARWALIEGRSGLGVFEEHGLAFVVVNININYRRPAVMGDVLRVDANLTRIGQRSAVIQQRVVERNSGEAVADADVTFVVIDQTTQRPLPIEGQLLELLEQFTHGERAGQEASEVSR